MSVVATHAPTTFGPSSMGQHHAGSEYPLGTVPPKTEPSDINPDGSITADGLKHAFDMGMGFVEDIKNSHFDKESQEVTNKMLEYVKRTIWNNEDLDEDPSIEEGLERWADRDLESATEAKKSFYDLIRGKALFRMASKARFPSDESQVLPTSWMNSSSNGNTAHSDDTRELTDEATSTEPSALQPFAIRDKFNREVAAGKNPQKSSRKLSSLAPFGSAGEKWEEGVSEMEKDHTEVDRRVEKVDDEGTEIICGDAYSKTPISETYSGTRISGNGSYTCSISATKVSSPTKGGTITQRLKSFFH